MNLSRVVKDGVLIGFGYGILLSSAFGFSIWIGPFFETANPMSLFFALWYAVLTPILAAFFFGIPWILTCALSAYGISLTLRKRTHTSLIENTLLGTLLSTFGAATTYLLYFKPLMISQQTCDSICLGLEKEWLLSTPLWVLILLAFASIGIVESCSIFFRNRGLLEFDATS